MRINFCANFLEMIVQFERRFRQIFNILSTSGIPDVLNRIRIKVSEKLISRVIDLPVNRDDVIAADLSHRLPVAMLTKKCEGPIIVNWVIVPTAPKSGGHTTIFRIIQYLEACGYLNRIYFYNVHHADHEYYESILRKDYSFLGLVGRLELEMEDAHAVFATSWETAYPVFNSISLGKRFYFVQDYEPFFHPVGTLSFLAENTYRMGFHAITAGRWLSQKLSEEFGMTAEPFNFGCDASVYSRHSNVIRNGVIFYARPEAPRRGYELGLMTMRIFSARRPDIKIHFYGSSIGKVDFPIIDHRKITPDKLNTLYNQCFGGLSLSLTNVSLVPYEMLAAGCIPVVNDAIQNRMVLDNPFVRYASPNPHSLATELEALVNLQNFDEFSSIASTSVRDASWKDAGATVDEILRRALRTTDDTYSQKGGID